MILSMCAYNILNTILENNSKAVFWYEFTYGDILHKN